MMRMDSPLRNLDIDLLRTFVSICESRSFSFAAERLGRTQSAISLQIKRLEEGLGQNLLQRSQGRVVGPTAEGQVLLDYALRILRLNDEVYACFRPGGEPGQLRLGLPEELMEGVFPRVLKQFIGLYPRIELSVHCDLSARLVARAESGEFDLVLAKQSSAQPLVESSSPWRVIKREALLWALGEGSNAAERTPLPIGVFHEGCVFRAAALAALGGAQQSWQLAFVGSSYTALRHAVLAGLAVAPLPESLLGNGLMAQRKGLPELPGSELLARVGDAPARPAAEHLLRLFETLL